jgi:long-chain acyl-CoA synthetase
VREIAGGLISLGFKPGEVGVDAVQHRHRMGAGRPGSAELRAVSANGIYPTDAASQVHYLCEDSRTTRTCSSKTTNSSDKALEVREPAADACARSSCSTWKACAELDDPGVISLDALRETGPRLQLAGQRRRD